MTLDELNELKRLAAVRERHLEMAEHVESRPLRLNNVFGMDMTDELKVALRAGTAAELRRRAAVAEARLRDLGVIFPGDTVPDVQPSVPVVFTVIDDTIVAKMCAADVERMRAASQAADDGYRAGC